MKRQKVDSSRERRLLISMITSTKFLSKATKLMDLSLIDSPHYRQVAEWCLEHWQRYKKAPGESIETIYHSWADGNSNEELVTSVHTFLDGLSKEYAKAKDPQNIPFLVDELSTLMKTRKLTRVKDDLEYALLKGSVAKAEKAITQYLKSPFEEEVGGDPMLQLKQWSETFADPLQPVIELDGDAGRFFNPALVRDALIAIQAPEKTGKTWWLIELAMRALRTRKKVAFFEVGDLSKRQLDLRLGCRWSSLPLWEWQLREGILLPSKIKLEDDEIGYSIRGPMQRPKEVVNELAVKRGIRRFRRACGMARGVSYLKRSIHPTNSINVGGIEDILNRWKIEEDFVPDVIIIDYADILAPEDRRDKRQAEHDRTVINETWMALRKLAQEWHALVITATQAKAKAYRQKLQTMESFSEDKRKLAHITGMFALNQTPEEKDIGGMRLNWIALREAPFNINRPLYVATCYALGRALCVAKFR